MKNTFIPKLLFLLIFASMQWLSYAQSDSTKQHIFVDYEIMPQFPGGDAALRKFVKERVYMPQDARDKGIEGRVVLRFVVTEEGYVSDVVILRGIHPQCDSIAISIVNQMPRWTPGSIDGKPRKVYFTLPIYFRLTDKANVKKEKAVCREASAGSE